MKYLVALFALLCASSFTRADALQATPTGSSGGSLGYTCTSNPGETPSCQCAGVDDCLAMDDAGVCNGELEDGSIVNDTSCTPGFGSCSCTWRPSQSTVSGFRPETHSSGTNMAPASEAPTPRDRRNTRRSNAVTLPQSSTPSRDHRSVGTDDDSEAETQTMSARRSPATIRDHRNDAGD
jgi:hypothetical protein